MICLLSGSKIKKKTLVSKLSRILLFRYTSHFGVRNEELKVLSVKYVPKIPMCNSKHLILMKLKIK